MTSSRLAGKSDWSSGTKREEVMRSLNINADNGGFDRLKVLRSKKDESNL